MCKAREIIDKNSKSSVFDNNQNHRLQNRLIIKHVQGGKEHPVALNNVEKARLR